MEFFDSIIDDFSHYLKPFCKKAYTYELENAWIEEDYSHIILQRDTLCELDGTGFNLVTSSPIEDGVFVIGDDIEKLKDKIKFARVCIVEIEDSKDEQESYNLIRKIDYLKYHLFPAGYMIRTSSRAHKECVRVSKAAVKDGISFSSIGNLLIKKYKENPSVKGVKVYFITDQTVDFSRIELFAQKGNSITETLNHIMNSVNFDCNTCKLKPICDEVEGMKELHFKNSESGML